LAQVPAWPVTLQALHEAHVAVLQQTPSTQLPLAHSAPAVHIWPSGLRLPHRLFVEHRLGETQSPLPAQVVLQALVAASQRKGVQGWLAPI
jgi:hypothetical protein